MTHHDISPNNQAASGDCTPMQHLMVELLWDAAERELPALLQEHLQTCETCRDAFQGMQHTVQQLPPSPDTALPEAYWEAFADNVIKQVAEKEKSFSVLQVIQGKLQKLRVDVANRQLFPRFGLAFALVCAGILIGRMWGGAVEPDSMIAIEPAPTELITSAQLTERTQRYLDRSSVLLLGLVNFDVTADDPAVIQMERKSVVAAELVDEARVLRADLNAGREQQLAQLIEDLERILMQIANLEAREDVPSIELIQRGVDHGSLLLKINLEQMRLEDRAYEQPASPAPDAGATF